MLIPWTTWTAACAIIPAVTAFYPYEPVLAGTRHASRRDELPRSDTRYAAKRSLTLPLRRVPLRSRDNQYKILNSADPKQKNSVAVDQDGSDISYMAAVTIGDSKKEYHLLLDSAATNTWVMGQDCTSEACGKHNTFGKGDSSSLKTSPTPFSITYGTGSISGTTATDTIHLSTLSHPLTFGLATNVSREFSAYPMDGILGLGFSSSASALAAPQLLSALADAKLIPSPLYAIALPRAADGAADGELNLGEVNTARFDGEITWTSTIENSDGFWEIPISDAGVAGHTLSLKPRSAVLDTGTSYIFMPPSDAAALHALVDGTSSQDGETFVVPCDTTQDIEMTFGDRAFPISHKDWVGGTVDGGGCRSNIFGRTALGEEQWLVGDVFLKNVYAVFDLGGGRVGFGIKSQGDGERGTATGSATVTVKSSATSTSEAGAFLPAAASAEATKPPSSQNVAVESAGSTGASAEGGSGSGSGSGRVRRRVGRGGLALCVGVVGFMVAV